MRISDWSSDVCSSDLKTQRQFTHGLLFLRFAATNDRDLASGFDNELGDGFGQVQAFLVHQARNHGEQRAAGVVEAEQVAYMSRSEEHTSEIQSLMRHSYAVLCLTKKKTSKQSRI